MSKREYRGFEDWMDLYNKYDKADMSIEDNQKALCRDFEDVSKLYFQAMIEQNGTKDAAEILSGMWCQGYRLTQEEGNTKKDYAEFALCRIWYSSDRMNINRWMHIRILLNKLID